MSLLEYFFVCEGVYCFHVVHPSLCLSATLCFSFPNISGNIANKVSSKLKLPFIFVSITSTHLESNPFNAI